MDPVGLLAATVAIVAFPGGAFAVVTGIAAAMGALPRRSHRGAPAEATGEAGVRAGANPAMLVALGLAAALVPLPGSPAFSLPGGAAADNLVALVGLVAVAAVLVRTPGPPWPAGELCAAIACAGAVLALGAAGASLGSDVVGGLGDPRGTIARLLAGAAVLLVAPTLADLGGERGGAARHGLAGVAAAVAVAVGEPAVMAAAPGVVSALAVVAAAVVAGGASLVPPRLREAAAAAAAAAAVVVAGTLL